MNLVENKSLYAHLRDEEAVVVENAVKLAIDSVLNVLYGLNGAKARECQRMVADKDKEIRRLEGRLTQLERELQALRRHGCTCAGLDGGPRGFGNRDAREQGGFGPGSVNSKMTAEPQEECEMMLSLGVFARPPSLVSPQSHESAPPSPASHLGSDPTCTSRSSEASFVPDASRDLLPSPSSLVVKEEPCDVDTVLIQWEMSEERTAEHPETSGSQRRDDPSLSGKHQNSPKGRNVKEHPEKSAAKQLREEPQPELGGFHLFAADQLKNRRRNVPMSQLPEEAQKQKRAAWRAASRRYYARKVARQRENPLRCGPVAPGVNSQQNGFTDTRMKLLISESPDSQGLQSEAWSRYYERKAVFHQPDNMTFGHVMENLNPSGAPQGPSGDGPLANSGGIMCS